MRQSECTICLSVRSRLVGRAGCRLTSAHREGPLHGVLNICNTTFHLETGFYSHRMADLGLHEESL